MRRRQLRLVVVAVAVSALLWVGYHVADILAHQRLGGVKKALRLLPDAEQRLGDFRRIKLEHGRMVWELRAREAQYDEDEKRAVVLDPEIIFYSDGEKRGSLSGKRGSVSFDGVELKRVDMEGGVRVEGDGYIVEADTATYERATDTIVAPGAVRILGDNITVEGMDMEVVVSSRKLTLKRDVHVTLTNSDEPNS